MNINDHKKITIVIPLFNDWASVEYLIKEILRTNIKKISENIYKFDFLLVNDGSYQNYDKEKIYCLSKNLPLILMSLIIEER